MRKISYLDQQDQELPSPSDIQQSLTPMIETLKGTVEAYLEGLLQNTEIVFPFPVPEAVYDVVYANLSSFRLEDPIYHQQPAGIRASQAYGWEGGCWISHTRWSHDGQNYDVYNQILTIDYSRAALTALLADACHIEPTLEIDRFLHETRLGTVLRSSNKRQAQEDIVKALREFTRERSHVSENGTRILKVFLMGESANDYLLNRAFEEALQLPEYEPIRQSHQPPRKHKELITTDEGNRGVAVEHLFAASRGVALDCWEQLDTKKYREGRSEL